MVMIIIQSFTWRGWPADRRNASNAAFAKHANNRGAIPPTALGSGIARIRRQCAFTQRLAPGGCRVMTNSRVIRGESNHLPEPRLTLANARIASRAVEFEASVRIGSEPPLNKQVESVIAALMKTLDAQV